MRMRENNTNVPILSNNIVRTRINGEMTKEAKARSMEAMDNRLTSFSQEGADTSFSSTIAVTNEETQCEEKVAWMRKLTMDGETDDDFQSGDDDTDSDETNFEECGLDTDDADIEADCDQMVSDTTTALSHVDAMWLERYNELVAFKNTRGHCDVASRSTEHPQLGNWVKQQRAMYKKGKILDDRKHRLNEIGFEWIKVNADALWLERYNELVAFKNTRGDCNVARSSTEHPQLGNWVQRQRGAYKKDSIRDDRKHRLNAIGFEWSREL